MAVFPDRIVLKNSTDSHVDIEAAIGSGGSDQITQGELVLGIQPGSVNLYTIDGNGDVVSLGSAVGYPEYIGELLDVDLTPAPTDGQILAYNATDGVWRPDTRLANVVEDLTPQLGGNLETMGFWIRGNQGNDIVLAADSGRTIFRGDPGNDVDASIRLNCSTNAHGVTIQSPAHSAGASYTLTLPESLGTDGQLLATDAAGALYWVDDGGGTSVGPTPPTGPGVGDLWIDINTDIIYYWDGSNWVVVGAGGSVTSIDIVGGTGINTTGGPITDSGTITVALADTAVVPGTYTNTNLTVDQQGRITSIANGEAGGEGGSAGRGDGGDFDLGTVGSPFVFGVYGGGDFDAAGASGQAVAPFAHAYITVDNVTSATSHTGMSSAAHVYSAGSSSYIDFTFDTARPNTDYSVLHSGEAGWNVLEVSNKTTSGFRVSFYDESTGDFLSASAVGVGAPVITVYNPSPTLSVPSSAGVDEPEETFLDSHGPDAGDFG